MDGMHHEYLRSDTHSAEPTRNPWREKQTKKLQFSRVVYRYKKTHTSTHTGILCPYQYEIPVYRLIRTSMSAFRLFPTNDPSNNKRWWRFICVDMFEVPPSSLTAELYCLHTTTPTLIRPSVFRCGRMKCFLGSDFRLVFGTRVYSISRVSAMLMGRSPFPTRNFGTFCFAFRKLPNIPVRTTALVLKRL